MTRAAWVAMVGAVVAAGCTTTRLAQRDGCWVRETKTFPGNVKEEVGFCSKPAPEWSNDRVARLTQECIVQADHRWQNRALAAWSAGQPMPAQPDEGSVARECMNLAAQSQIKENETLQYRLSELSQDLHALRGRADEDTRYMRQSNDRMATALGDAAKKPAPTATATSSSNSNGTGAGTATTSNELRSSGPARTAPTAPTLRAPTPSKGPAQLNQCPPSAEEASSAQITKVSDTKVSEPKNEPKPQGP